MDKPVIRVLCMFLSMAALLFVLNQQNGTTLTGTQLLITIGLALCGLVTAAGSIAALLERHLPRR